MIQFGKISYLELRNDALDARQDAKQLIEQVQLASRDLSYGREDYDKLVDRAMIAAEHYNDCAQMLLGAQDKTVDMAS